MITYQPPKNNICVLIMNNLITKIYTQTRHIKQNLCKTFKNMFILKEMEFQNRLLGEPHRASSTTHRSSPDCRPSDDTRVSHCTHPLATTSSRPRAVAVNVDATTTSHVQTRSIIQLKISVNVRFLEARDEDWMKSKFILIPNRCDQHWTSDERKSLGGFRRWYDRCEEELGW